MVHSVLVTKVQRKICYVCFVSNSFSVNFLFGQPKGQIIDAGVIVMNSVSGVYFCYVCMNFIILDYMRDCEIYVY